MISYSKIEKIIKKYFKNVVTDKMAKSMVKCFGIHLR